MATNVVLAVGLDSWQLTAQSSALRSAGFVFVSAMSNREAIEHFKAGDFDLVLLGHSIPMEQKERLTFLIRENGSRTPVVCIAKLPSDCNPYADATLDGNIRAILEGMRSVLARAAKAWTDSSRIRGNEASRLRSAPRLARAASVA
jgi:DNA-binding NtrC family response regulator